MKFHWPFILLIPVVFVAISIASARQAQEQTAFLERAADAFEQTRQIPLDAEYAIQNTIDSFRWRTFTFGKALIIRQRIAIDRIEAALSPTGISHAGGLANGEAPRRYYVPSE